MSELCCRVVVRVRLLDVERSVQRAVPVCRHFHCNCDIKRMDLTGQLLNLSEPLRELLAAI
jgi:hypothetical protein